MTKHFQHLYISSKQLPHTSVKLLRKRAEICKQKLRFQPPNTVFYNYAAVMRCPDPPIIHRANLGQPVVAISGPADASLYPTGTLWVRCGWVSDTSTSQRQGLADTVGASAMVTYQVGNLDLESLKLRSNFVICILVLLTLTVSFSRCLVIGGSKVRLDS